MSSGEKCKTEHFLVFAQIFMNVEAQKMNNFLMVVEEVECHKHFFTALGITHIQGSTPHNLSYFWDPFGGHISFMICSPKCHINDLLSSFRKSSFISKLVEFVIFKSESLSSYAQCD
jgi:hypothetical protein